ncbi:MAG: nucleotide exchange factor GrpE [Saprospiraceae bacterium]
MNDKEIEVNLESTMEGLEQQEVADQNEEALENEQTQEQQASSGQELEALKIQNEELKDKYLRLYAEFENYKRRALKEKIDYMATAAQDTLTALLPVLDDFDRAKKAADATNGAEPFSEGIALVYHKLNTTLKNKGLTAMESTGKAFDPEFHEAVVEIPAPSEEMKGKVIDTIETGYQLKDKIIRYAKVVVGK